MKSDIKDAQQFLSAKELSETIRSLEEASISAVRDCSSPYHIIYRSGSVNERIAEYHHPNIRFILQDSIVSPVADAIVSLLGLKKNVKNEDYHIIEENGRPCVCYLKDFKTRESLGSCFDVKRVAEQMAVKVSDKIKSDSDNLFYVAVPGRRFVGMNLDGFVWNQIASDIEKVFISYIDEKYSNFAQSSYFSRPYGKIDTSLLSDVLVGNGMRSAPGLIGTKTLLSKVRKRHTGQHVSERSFSLPMRYDPVLDEIALHICDEVKITPRSDKDRYFSPMYKKYFSNENSSSSFLAWLRGTYHKKPGVTVSPVNRSILVEKDISLSLDWVKDEDMANLMKGARNKMAYYFRKMESHDAVELHTGCSSRFFVWGDYGNPLVPKKVMSLKAFQDGINYLIQEKIKKRGVSIY